MDKDFDDFDELAKDIKSEITPKKEDIDDTEDTEKVIKKEVKKEDFVTSENLEEHYSKMYKDLPPDVVKMLISTHPLYSKSKSAKIDEGEKSKSEELAEPKKSIEIPLKEAAITEEAEQELEKESPKIKREEVEIKKHLSSEKKPTEAEAIKKPKKAVSKEKTDKPKSTYIKSDNVEGDEEFLYDLFPKKTKGKEKSSGNLKSSIIIGILTISLIVCIIGMIASIIQNNKTREVLDKLEEEKKALEIEKNNEEEMNKLTVEELKAEIQGLRAKYEQVPVVDENPPEITEQNPSDEPTNNVEPTIKTYVVQSNDNPWKISEKMYGNGKYYAEIMKANKLKEDAVLRPGTTLIIPDLGGE